MVTSQRAQQAAGSEGETSQRVVHRSLLYSSFLTALVFVALALLAYAVVQSNRHLSFELLDTQSAATLLVASGGAALARGQYARASRPLLGWFGRVMTDVAPGQQPVWACHVFNGQDSCTVTEVRYRVLFSRGARRRGVRDIDTWARVDEISDAIAALGLVAREDFLLDFVDRGRPLPGNELMFIGWFNKKTLQEVDEVLARVRVIDRLGDTHERVMALLKGADRDPRHPGPAPF